MDTVIDEPATIETDKDTQSTESTEENVQDDTSTDGSKEDAATKKQLADKDRYIKELEAKKPDTRSEEIKDLEWRLENKERINLVTGILLIRVFSKKNRLFGLPTSASTSTLFCCPWASTG